MRHCDFTGSAACPARATRLCSRFTIHEPVCVQDTGTEAKERSMKRALPSPPIVPQRR